MIIKHKTLVNGLKCRRLSSSRGNFFGCVLMIDKSYTLSVIQGSDNPFRLGFVRLQRAHIAKLSSWADMAVS